MNTISVVNDGVIKVFQDDGKHIEHKASLVLGNGFSEDDTVRITASLASLVDSLHEPEPEPVGMVPTPKPKKKAAKKVKARTRSNGTKAPTADPPVRGRQPLIPRATIMKFLSTTDPNYPKAMDILLAEIQGEIPAADRGKLSNNMRRLVEQGLAYKHMDGAFSITSKGRATYFPEPGEEVVAVEPV